MDVAPRSTAAITPADRGMLNKDERLPPSDFARPPSTSNPASSNCCTSIETLLRLTPTSPVNFDREIGPASAHADFMISD
jgi:hypothetical protein